MGRHKKHEEHVNHERWLVSYADFITLLFAFFVVMFATAPKDDANTRRITAATQNSFSTFAIFRGGGSKIHGKRMKQRGDGVELDSSQETPLITDPSKLKAEFDRQTNMTTSNEDFKPNSRSRDQIMQDFFKEIVDANGNLDVSMESRGLVVSFSDVAFFSTGSHEFQQSQKGKAGEAFEAVMKIIGQRKNLIQIEGHSDGTTQDKGRYKTNMEISQKRAEAVARILIDKYGVPEEYISTVGYGDFRPRGDNKKKSGRAKNRRVDLVLLKSVPDAKKLVVPNIPLDDVDIRPKLATDEVLPEN